MHRVRIPGLPALALAALVLASCSGEPEVDLAPAAGPNTALDDAFPIDQATGSVLAFTKAVWPVISAEPNFVFSPLAAVSAIAVLTEGAGDPAATELAAAGGLPGMRAKLAGGFEVALRNLPRSPDHATRVRWMNTLSVTGDTTPDPAITAAAAKYATTVRRDDLADGAALLRDIENTTGLTPEIPNALFGSKASLVATSAVSIQGQWLRPFVSRQTRPFPFDRGEKDTLSVLSVGNVDSLQAGYGVEWLMVELPYVEEELALYAIIPYPGYTLGELETMLPDSIGSWLGQLGPHHISVRAPSFRIRSDHDLLPVMKALGVKAPLAAGSLDKVAPGAHLTGFFQSAGFEFSTHGSGVTQSYADRPPRPAGTRSDIFISMDLMQPFLFVVVDTQRNLLTLVGRVADPSKLESAG